MLDQSILEQLAGVFQSLKNDVTLVQSHCSHEKESELTEMLNELASTNSRIRIEREGSTKLPHVTIKGTGVSFSGIPGGHEFSSLVLAILHSGGAGKFPDETLRARIRAIKGPVEIKTYMSLSCENCPEVVQALNLMAILHSDFKHTTVDGALAQEEIEALGIQGVPSVVREGKLLHSGKSNLVELIGKLEKSFGHESVTIDESKKDLGVFDVVVLGGGPAGASAAIYSARKGLKTSVIAERLGGQVQDTKGIENFISLTYTEGPQLSAKLGEHIAFYGIALFEHRKVKEIKNGEFKEILLDSGEHLKTKSLIVATGAKWRELGIPGEKEYLGRGVAFCPHCDGPYFKGKDIAVVGGGNSGVEAAIDLAGIVKSVTLVEFNAELKADRVLVNKLKSIPNINVVTNARSEKVVGDNGQVLGLEYEDRALQEKKFLEVAGIFVQIGLVPNSDFIKNIVATNRFGEIIVDERCRTNAPGIYAAGDVSTVPYKQIVIAMGEGAKAGLTSFEDLMFHRN